MLIKAVLFDLDGTLVDSVDLHAQAWMDASGKLVAASP
jgi:beta-phosphoglucomutase-like phosphatase (HAD superfamily)